MKKNLLIIAALAAIMSTSHATAWAQANGGSDSKAGIVHKRDGIRNVPANIRVAEADASLKGDIHASAGLNANANANVSTSEDAKTGVVHERDGIRNTPIAKSIISHIQDWSFNPGVAGTVTAMNGSSITIQAGTNGSTYTVDASNATIKNETNAVSSISVGENVFVQGAFNGSSIVATNVTEFKNNNKPVSGNISGVVGTVSAVNGSSITIVGKNGTTYTVDANSAKVWKDRKTASSISDVAVGDTLIIQGTVNGANVVASNVYDVKLEGDSHASTNGTVTALSDSTITLLATDGTTYAVNASAATVKGYGGKDGSLSIIHVGDHISVIGAVNGTSITATTISDAALRRGLLQSIGNFFKNIFTHK